MASSKAYLLALAVALAASLTSLGNGFVFDDVPVIQQDRRIHSLDSLPTLVSAPFWTKDYRSNAYRPATTLAFAADWALGRGHPFVFHLTNVVLNLVIVALVLTLAARVLAPGGALVAALWFAVQPVHVETVAGGVGLAELLAAAGYLGALALYLADGDAADAGDRSGGQRGRGALALGVLVCAAVAYGAKEHAITLPAALLLADAWQAQATGRAFADRLRRHAVLWLGVVVLGVGYLAARAAVLGPAFSGGAVAPGLEGQSLLGRALVMAPAYLVWLRWFVWPVHFSADYLPNAFVPHAQFGLAQLAGFLALATLGYVAWAVRRRAPGLMAGILFAGLAASVTANLVVPTGVLLAERLAYLPSVGLAVGVGALWQLIPVRRATWPATAALLALLAARTLERVSVWHDQQRFLAALVADAPDSYRTHWALGAEAFRRGAFGTGERELLAAIRIYPDEGALVQELGEKYLEAGFFSPAARFLSAAARLDTLSSDAVVRTVFAYLKGGHADSAAAVGAAGLRRFPEEPALLTMTSEAYLALGRPRQALALARRAAFASPHSSSYQVAAGFAAASNERCDEARGRFQLAASLAPSQSGPRDALRRLRTGPNCSLGDR